MKRGTKIHNNKPPMRNGAPSANAGEAKSKKVKQLFLIPRILIESRGSRLGASDPSERLSHEEPRHHTPLHTLQPHIIRPEYPSYAQTEDLHPHQ